MTPRWTADDRELMKADKVLRRLMEEGGPIDPKMDRRGSRPNPYEALARATAVEVADAEDRAIVDQDLADLS